MINISKFATVTLFRWGALFFSFHVIFHVSHDSSNLFLDDLRKVFKIRFLDLLYNFIPLINVEVRHYWLWNFFDVVQEHIHVSERHNIFVMHFVSQFNEILQ